MTCKDCLHCDICAQDNLPTDLHPTYIDFSVRDDVEESCKDFVGKNSILTEQEANTPVTFRDLQIMLEELSKTLCEAKKADYDVLKKSFDNITNVLVNQILDLRCKQARDMRFCLELFSEISHISKDSIYSSYNRWCEEFDRLYKKEEQ